MSDAKNLRKWNEFVEIGNNIHKMKGVLRTMRAQEALKYARDLQETEFIIDSEERLALYDILLPKIAEYLDGNAEVIQTAIREYFLIQHGRAHLNSNMFDITFSPKKNGVQSGFTCDVSNGTRAVRYFTKTHQNGPTNDNLRSVLAPDTKELFIYKLLSLIGIGPQVHFIMPYQGTKKTVYIATEECDLVLLSELTIDTANNDALLQLDLISRILCLRDCTTNPTNCGQVGKNAMIVDFRIEKQQNYVDLEILADFHKGNGRFIYGGLMATAVNMPPAAKMDGMKKSLQAWKLLESIELAESEIAKWVESCRGKMRFEDDLQLYVKGIKANVEVLINS
jgi:hypothetical protein